MHLPQQPEQPTAVAVHLNACGEAMLHWTAPGGVQGSAAGGGCGALGHPGWSAGLRVNCSSLCVSCSSSPRNFLHASRAAQVRGRCEASRMVSRAGQQAECAAQLAACRGALSHVYAYSAGFITSSICNVRAEVAVGRGLRPETCNRLPGSYTWVPASSLHSQPASRSRPSRCCMARRHVHPTALCPTHPPHVKSRATLLRRAP